MNEKPKHLHVETTRHGKTVQYVRVNLGKRVRVKAEFGTPKFWTEYNAAIEGKPLSHRLVRPASQKNFGKIALALEKGVARARLRSKKKGLEFNIDTDWALDRVIKQGYRCALTGIPFFEEHTANCARSPFAPSIDRVNPARGYTKDNCRIVVHAVNVMLLDWGTKIFERVANMYRKNSTDMEHSISAPHFEASAPINSINQFKEMRDA